MDTENLQNDEKTTASACNSHLGCAVHGDGSGSCSAGGVTARWELN